MDRAQRVNRIVGAAPAGAIWNEVLGVAKQLVLLPLDTAAPVIPAEARDGDDVVVLMHGLFSSAGVFRPLRAAIARHAAARRGGPARAVHTATLSYLPGLGVEALAERLAALTAALPKSARLHLVGHSLGGIVCRYFAQESGDSRVVQTISMASPFGGFRGVGLLGMRLARDLQASSHLLQRIVSGAARSRIPHLSIVAGGDLLVRPPLAHALPGSQVQLMPDCGHNLVLFDPEVAALVAERVTAAPRRSGSLHAVPAAAAAATASATASVSASASASASVSASVSVPAPAFDSDAAPASAVVPASAPAARRPPVADAA